MRRLKSAFSAIYPENLLAPCNIKPLFLVLTLLAFKLGHLSSGAYWDEAGIYLNPVLNLNKNGLFSLFTGTAPNGEPLITDFSYGHPYLLTFLMTLSTKIFGFNIISARLVLLLISGI